MRESRSWVISVRPIQRAFTFDDVAFFISFLFILFFLGGGGLPDNRSQSAVPTAMPSLQISRIQREGGKSYWPRCPPRAPSSKGRALGG
jgi:hypothetical protein